MKWTIDEKPQLTSPHSDYDIKRVHWDLVCVGSTHRDFQLFSVLMGHFNTMAGFRGVVKGPVNGTRPRSTCTCSPAWLALACLARWSLLVNFLSHCGQENFFSPVWVLRWRCSSSDLVNLLPQNNQLQMNGRSPVCQRRWAFKWDDLLYTYVQRTVIIFNITI